MFEYIGRLFENVSKSTPTQPPDPPYLCLPAEAVEQAGI
jgi:hypothetical protein